MLRGEVWWADFGAPRGSAPALRRPALIVSADTFNQSAVATVVVVVLTSNLRRASVPGNVVVAAGTGGLAIESVADVTQLATIDRRDLTERVGALPDWLLEEVDAGLRRSLDL